MYCAECGNQIPEGHGFCSKCGQQAGVRRKTPARKTFLVGGIIFVLALVAVGFWANQSSSSRAATPQVNVQPPQPKLYTQAIGNTAFTVNAETDMYYKFSVPSEASDVKLQGHFSAMGGAGNDIVVFVLSDDAFVNWQNGHQSGTFYNSGKVTQDTVDVSLPSDPRTYYLVF